MPTRTEGDSRRVWRNSARRRLSVVFRQTLLGPRMGAMNGESIRVTRSVSIPLSEIELRFSRSSGPGGQHAQKSETRVEALFDVEASTSLTTRQKHRVVRKAGSVLRAVAQDERSQARNRELAIERVAEALREALHVERPRR